MARRDERIIARLAPIEVQAVAQLTQRAKLTRSELIRHLIRSEARRQEILATKEEEERP